MTLYEKALDLAKTAHKGQKDKAGVDYIYHPMTVASFVESDKEKAVAMLHDILEDTDTPESLLREMFGDEVTDAVVLLTHKAGEAYTDYVMRIRDSGNKLALAVKRADLRHNMDLSRLPVVTDEDIQRVEKKYKAALNILEGNRE